MLYKFNGMYKIHILTGFCFNIVASCTQQWEYKIGKKKQRRKYVRRES